MKALVEIPQTDLKALKPICELKNISRSEAIRRAIHSYILDNTIHADPNKADKVFGLWKNSPVDGLNYQRKIRAEWK